MQKFKLNENLEIPAIGFGTWQITGDTCTDAVNVALEVGYRHIDTATAYRNHKDIAKALKSSSLKRTELFVTSKLWIDSFGKENALNACKRAIEELGTEYLDLYLMHWPIRNTNLVPTFEAFTQLKEEGLIREWGVSNFTIHHLQDALYKGFHPANNQVEFHPSLFQKNLKEFCDKNNILLTAYSPIAQGEDLQIPEIKLIAQKYQKSPSQVILNWIIQKGIVAIPKATTKDHITDNFEILGWMLDIEDIEQMNTLNKDNRLIAPAFSDFDY